MAQVHKSCSDSAPNHRYFTRPLLLPDSCFCEAQHSFECGLQGNHKQAAIFISGTQVLTHIPFTKEQDTGAKTYGAVSGSSFASLQFRGRALSFDALSLVQCQLPDRPVFETDCIGRNMFHTVGFQGYGVMTGQPLPLLTQGPQQTPHPFSASGIGILLKGSISARTSVFFAEPKCSVYTLTRVSCLFLYPQDRIKHTGAFSNPATGAGSVVYPNPKAKGDPVSATKR